MKYRVSDLTHTQNEKRYVVKSEDSKHETAFSFSKGILVMWGRPLAPDLKELMVAHIKRNGWSKTPVVLDTKNSSKNLNQQIAALNKKAGK